MSSGKAMQAVVTEKGRSGVQALAPVKVLYIAGMGRSGSTLLDRLLGHSPGYVSTAELYRIWHAGFLENRHCGCGKHIRSCEFWNDVAQEAFGGWDNVDPTEPGRAWAAICRLRDFPHLWMPSACFRGEKENIAILERYWTPLYRAIQKVSGSQIVVDSSKSPSGAFFLNRNPNLEIYILHLIRDSRAVAYSFQRTKAPDGADLQNERALIMPPWKSSILWNISNAMAERLRDFNPRYLRLRYWELIQRPRQTLEEIGRFVGLPVDTSMLVGENKAKLSASHTMGGNPDRFKNGEIPLQMDVEWRQKMPWTTRAFVSALTLPWLSGYGYFQHHGE
jgi:hypothetical protein